MKIISKLFFLYFFYSHNAKAAFGEYGENWVSEALIKFGPEGLVVVFGLMIFIGLLFDGLGLTFERLLTFIVVILMLYGTFLLLIKFFSIIN